MNKRHCESCLLSCNPIVSTKGNPNAKYLFVFSPISGLDDYARVNMVIKESRRLLYDFVEMYGLDLSDFALTYSVLCSYDVDLHKAKDRKVIENTCRKHLCDAINSIKPEVIIPLGKQACNAVFNKPVKVTKVTGVLSYSSEFNAHVLPVLDPAIAYKQPYQIPLLKSDIATLSRVIRNDFDEEAIARDLLGRYQIVNDLQFLVDDPPEELSFDIETVGLDYLSSEGKIVSMQFSSRVGESWFLPWDHPEMPMPLADRDRIVNQLQLILQNPDTSVIGHNSKFDCKWIMHSFGDNMRYRNDHDTLIMASLLNENLQRKNLDILIKLYVPSMAGYADAFNKKHDKSRMDLVPLQDLVDYACGDTDATLRLFHVLKSQLIKDEKLWTCYRQVSMPGINALMMLDVRGMNVDSDRLLDLQNELTEYVNNLYLQLIDQTPKSILRDHVEAGLKFSRADFIRDILFDHPDGFRLTPQVFTKSTKKLRNSDRVPSTSSKDHLPYFFEECPYTELLAEYIKLNRMLTANVIKFKEKYVKPDGKIYPKYKLDNAVTGRTSSEDPNGQNFPERGVFAKKLKAIFVAPKPKIIITSKKTKKLKRYGIVKGDLSQSELRIAACMAKDETMIDIFNSGGDIHSATACAVMGIDEEDFYSRSPEEISLSRFRAKAVNFGFIFGMGYKKFMVYAKTSFGLDFSLNESEHVRHMFFNKYYRLEAWHNRVREFVQTHKYVRSYSGRVRHLEAIDSYDFVTKGEAQRQAINAPVQEFSSTLGVCAVHLIDTEINPAFMYVNGFVHDAIYCIAPLENLVWAAQTLKEYMENVPIFDMFGVQLDVPIVADVAIGIDNSKTYELKGLTYSGEDYSLIDNGIDVQLPKQVTPVDNGRQEIKDYLLVTL